MDRVKVGIIGCGNISSNYLKHSKLFPSIEITTLADLDVARAQARATEFGIARGCTVKELLADDAISIVVNLTIPKVHASVALACIKAGKHVYNEKPLALDRKEGKQLLAAAAAKRLRVGAAPDTFLGSGHQTARKLIDDGAIGRPVVATAFMMGRGHESWHPDPAFYYEPGGGPMFDMGPYYLTALMQMLGPIKRVCGFASIAIPQRTITSKPKEGQVIKVKTPDHVAGTIEFTGGAVATIITSFAAAHSPLPRITIYGENGTLDVPDPNHFDGPVKICRGIQRGAAWEDVAPTHCMGYGRIVGVVDMAYAIQARRAHRASGDQGFAVLDAMQGFLDSSKTGKAVTLKSKYKRPKALPAGLAMGVLDE